MADSIAVTETAPLEAPNRNLCKSFSQLPLSSESGTNKAVKARLWLYDYGLVLRYFCQAKGFKTFEVVLILFGSGRMIYAEGGLVPARDHPA